MAKVQRIERKIEEKDLEVVIVVDENKKVITASRGDVILTSKLFMSRLDRVNYSEKALDPMDGVDYKKMKKLMDKAKEENTEDVSEEEKLINIMSAYKEVGINPNTMGKAQIKNDLLIEELMLTSLSVKGKKIALSKDFLNENTDYDEIRAELLDVIKEENGLSTKGKF